MAKKQYRTIDRGLTLAYIGNGKGKTTAATGVAVRARGYGWPVLFFQFFKSEEWQSGERTSLRKLGIDVRVRGKGFVGILGDRKPVAVHKRAARHALDEARKLLFSGRYKLVVLDEAISCIKEKLLAVQDLVKLLNERSKHTKARAVHLVLTGHDRYAPILERCDLVTEMKMVKHPYYEGILAVKGIDY